MHVDIWSDIVCPWCYIGKRRFERALEGFEVPGGVTVVHRSFQLDPSRPLGQTHNRRQMLMTKYHRSAQQVEAMDAQMEQLAAADGLEYHLRPEGVTGNTRQAHELVHLGRSNGIGDAVDGAVLPGVFHRGPVGVRSGVAGGAGRRSGARPGGLPPGARGGHLHRGRRGGGRPGARISAPTACRSSSSTRASASRARSRWRCFATRWRAPRPPPRRKHAAPDGAPPTFPRLDAGAGPCASSPA